MEHALHLSAFSSWQSIIEKVIELGAEADGVPPEQFVRAALEADLAAVRREQEVATGAPEAMAMSGTAAGVAVGAISQMAKSVQLSQISFSLLLIEARVKGLLGYAWLINKLLEGLTLAFDEPPSGSAASSDQVGWPLLAIILALYAHYCNGGNRRLLVVPNLIGVNEHDIDSCVDLWSWRLTSAVADKLRIGAFPRMVMCVVTRRLTLITDHRSATEEAHKAEMEQTFGRIMSVAQGTATYMNLAPLDEAGRARYLYELLRERHGYLGDPTGVPRVLTKAVSERAAGHPKFIEELLREMINVKAVTVEHHASGSRVRAGSLDMLRSVPPPPSTQATLLQVFDCLPAPLQSILKRVSPLDYFSEGILNALDLSKAVTGRTSSMLARAVDEGLLEEVSPVPPEIKRADPGAVIAWKWCHPLMKQQIESMVLSADTRATQEAVANLNEHHEMVAKRVERARNAFRTHLHQPSLFSRTRVSLSTHFETNDPVELRKRLDAATQRCELAERRLRELQALHRRERRGSWRFLAMWRRLFNRSKLSRVDPQVKP